MTVATRSAVLLSVFVVAVAAFPAQTPASPPTPSANASPADPLAQLTPEQKDRFQSAVKNANGTVTQMHMTFGFFDGQPAYDVVRERILAIAEGKKAPISRSDPSTAPPALNAPATPR